MSWITNAPPPGGGPPIINPEFTLPVCFDNKNNTFQYVEQGSPEEVAQRIWAVLSYEPGMLTALPTFGLPSQVFRKNGADMVTIEKVILEWVPDANEIIERDPNWLTTMVDSISIRRNLTQLS